LPKSRYFVAKSAIVEKGAKIGEGSKIWHFSHIMAGAQIGKNCTIGQNVFVADGAKIGNKVKIQNNVSVYSGVNLQDEVFCGPSVVFTNVRKPRSSYPVHKNYVKTLVKQGATIGANATIVCGVTIGRFAFIGAGSVVTKDIADFALVYGNAAKQKGWVCRCAEILKITAKAKRCVCRKCNRKYSYTGNKLIEE
jgi:UDP-2-acetamido-3-amino-2,3-dideoxy-glucuronate N-acetyltransferase